MTSLRTMAVLLLFTMVLAFSGCTSFFTKVGSPSGDVDHDDFYAMSDSTSAPMPMDYEEGGYGFDEARSLLSDESQLDQKIIKTGSLDLHVDDVRETVTAIEALVPEWGGSVLNKSVSRGEASYYAFLQVRVPAEGFDSAMEGLTELAIYVESEWTNADDVTEAYMDLQARLNNAYVEEQAYLDLMNRAGSITEILEVTRALTDVRSDIEYMENQINYYDTRVAYSTIDLYLAEDDSVSAVTEKWRPWSTITDAFGDWIVFLQGLLDAGIYLVIFGWPLLIIGWFVWRWLHKDKKRK